MSFWPLKACDKIDILNEHRHERRLHEALLDGATQVEELDTIRFRLYGPDEAILIIPESKTIKIALWILQVFLEVVKG